MTPYQPTVRQPVFHGPAFHRSTTADVFQGNLAYLLDTAYVWQSTAATPRWRDLTEGLRQNLDYPIQITHIRRLTIAVEDLKWPLEDHFVEIGRIRSKADSGIEVVVHLSAYHGRLPSDSCLGALHALEWKYHTILITAKGPGSLATQVSGWQWTYIMTPIKQ
jgi:hypothetical protein